MARHTCNCCRTTQSGDQFARHGKGRKSKRSRMCRTCENDPERQAFHKQQNAEILEQLRAENP